MAVILREHKRHENIIKNEGRTMVRIISPIAIFLFACIALLGYLHPNKDVPLIWLGYVGAALAFLILWIVSEIKNRPKKV
jgi:1,4-dihydroxy-2-naphthoate octaprenyltransferase